MWARNRAGDAMTEPAITAGPGRRARAEARRIRAAPGHHRAGADVHRTRHLLGDVERALFLQVVEEMAADAAHHRAAGDLRAGRECGRRGYRRRAGAWSSRWRATTTPPTSSPIRARRPAWAASCATSSPWARGPIAAMNALSLRRAVASEDRASGEGRGRGRRRLRQRLRRADRGRRGAVPPQPTTATAW